jgi:pimeloyl-ACP methyl ester carboxylesterase
LFCCHCCSSERLGSQLAFFPPNPPSYALLEDTQGKIHARYTDGGSQIIAGGRLAAFDAHYVTTKHRNTIVVLSMDAPEDAGDKKKAITLVVSHGNALDAGMFVPFGRKLRDALHVNVVLYDYSGYGRSTGKATPRNVSSDLEAVVDWCVREKGAEASRILLYGQSIGSAPTCRYAAKAGAVFDHLERAKRKGSASSGALPTGSGGLPKTAASKIKKNRVGAAPLEDRSGVGALERCVKATKSTVQECLIGTETHHLIGGVVLISPIMSGLRVISGAAPGPCAPAFVFGACDVFQNHRRAGEIRCPTLVVHGTRDVQVPFRHGQAISDALLGVSEKPEAGGCAKKPTAAHPPPYWVSGAGHDDVYERDPKEFLSRLKGFVASIARRAETAEVRETASGFNAIRDEAETRRDVLETARRSALRDDGVPVRAMAMTRE